MNRAGRDRIETDNKCQRMRTTQESLRYPRPFQPLLELLGEEEEN
jgi:hypothetical protein